MEWMDGVNEAESEAGEKGTEEVGRFIKTRERKGVRDFKQDSAGSATRESCFGG